MVVFCRLLAVVLFALVGSPKTEAQDYSNLFRTFRADTLSWNDRRFLQAALAFEGHYNGLLDGDWGPRSQRAMQRFSRQEFGSATEDWHMALLAFGFFQLVDRDGWQIEYFDGLNMSMLFPNGAARTDPATDNFVNFRHRNSSLSYSVGVHSRATTQRLHDYTEHSAAAGAEPYILRRQDYAITSVTQPDGAVLYTRSNFTNGAWRTIMLSANRRDTPLLNAVAGSIAVGRTAPLQITENGTLETAILQTAAVLSAEEDAPQTSVGTPAKPATPQVSSGTGFVVDAKGHVLTNAHVIEGCSAITFNGMPATRVAASEDDDLALLHVSDWSGDDFARFSPTPARLNSDVTVVGFPLAGILSGLNVTRGAVSSKLGFGGEIGGMQITAPVQTGNSGGPVLAADGEVVGVVVSKLDERAIAEATGDTPQNVNFAIRGELAKLFLFQNGIEPQLGTSDAPLPPTELADMATTFTGFIECRG
ncbi:S1 family peptidase [Thalassorhabdomicrobium marinisediminis]|uniref:S1 family peptidase n=1 Tax=Thalassorhabdomicrobium marinisediminis TaxID=2170577 RepID=UPI002493705F|nr:serine protease [Thalassorhabdomicrobium marinisediminis]